MVQDFFVHQHGQMFNNSCFSNKRLESLYYQPKQCTIPQNHHAFASSLIPPQYWSDFNNPLKNWVHHISPGFPWFLGMFLRKSTARWLHCKGLKLFQGDEGCILSLIHVLQGHPTTWAMARKVAWQLSGEKTMYKRGRRFGTHKCWTVKITRPRISLVPLWHKLSKHRCCVLEQACWDWVCCLSWHAWHRDDFEWVCVPHLCRKGRARCHGVSIL